MLKISDINWDDLQSLGLSNEKKIQVRNYILNQPPPEKWLKKHPAYGNTYLPIDRVEYLLIGLFSDYRTEVKEIKQVANSMVCTVRLYYWNSIKNEYDWRDGTGAAPIQQDSETKELKFNGVMLATPISKVNAIKDAADEIGRIFGRDLNRKNLISFDKKIEQKYDSIV